MNEIFKTRKAQWHRYQAALQESNKVQLLTITKGCDFNCAYFPVVFESEAVLLKVMAALNLQYIQPRRYFFPSLNTINYVDNNSCPNSESIAQRVLCLPLYHTLRKEDQDLILKVVLKNI